MLSPLLREAKEAVVESLEKGAEGGNSIYFARRGTFDAQGALPFRYTLQSGEVAMAPQVVKNKIKSFHELGHRKNRERPSTIYENENVKEELITAPPPSVQELLNMTPHFQVSVGLATEVRQLRKKLHQLELAGKSAEDAARKRSAPWGKHP